MFCSSIFYVSRSEIPHTLKSGALILATDNISDLERLSADPFFPFGRLLMAARSVHLVAKQITTLKNNLSLAKVDSCTFLSPTIVLIIGESYNKHHSHLYGYPHPTTPCQDGLRKEGLLIPFEDVVTPWNLTSQFFKYAFSMHALEEKGEWCDKPLFTELFKKAGYHVSFLSNQFFPRLRQTTHDFSGSFFLNDSLLSKAQFDVRNESGVPYDEELLAFYRKHEQEKEKHKLVIFHLLGQHVSYEKDYPPSFAHFSPKSYHRPELSMAERQILAHYDNATLYNDHILNLIVSLFKNDEAIIIHVPDHGEGCFDNGTHYFGRRHESPSAHIARYQYEIPFWVLPTKAYQERHTDVVSRLRQAATQPFMTDNLAQMMLSLGGIHCLWYNAKADPLSSLYDIHRKRLLHGEIDYNELMSRGGHM